MIKTNLWFRLLAVTAVTDRFFTLYTEAIVIATFNIESESIVASQYTESGSSSYSTVPLLVNYGFLPVSVGHSHLKVCFNHAAHTYA